MFTEFIRHSFLVVVLLSGAPLIASAAGGLVIAIVQAATQVQEQSISYLARLAAVITVMAFAGSWFGEQLIALMQESWRSIALLGKW